MRATIMYAAHDVRVENRAIAQRECIKVLIEF
jgi:hypothetical protein